MPSQLCAFIVCRFVRTDLSGGAGTIDRDVSGKCWQIGAPAVWRPSQRPHACVPAGPARIHALTPSARVRCLFGNPPASVRRGAAPTHSPACLPAFLPACLPVRPPARPPACLPACLQESVSGMISVLESKELQGTWHDYAGNVVPW